MIGVQLPYFLNPNKIIDDSIKEEWGKFMSDKIPKYFLSDKKIKSEKFPINFNGFLKIRWPKGVIRKIEIEKYDFLIATVTNPTLIDNKYPTVRKIANAMKKENTDPYFIKNIEYEITTFQDKRILNIISETKRKRERTKEQKTGPGLNI